MPDPNPASPEQVIQSKNINNRKMIWLTVGIVTLFIFLLTPPAGGLSPEAWYTLGILASTIIWWVSEALPIPVTALLIFLTMDLTGVMSLTDSIEIGLGATIIIFMIGALALSAAFQYSGLSTRITRMMLNFSGPKPWAIIGVIFWTSFVFSMFITDVAVVAMMLPPAIAILRTAKMAVGRSNFGKAMMMAVMFGAAQGGACTPAGVSANVATLGILQENANINVGFLEWTLIATPAFVVLGLITWWLILRIFKPEVDGVANGLSNGSSSEYKWTRSEISTAVIFGLIIVLWLGEEITGVDKEIVSLLAIGLLFLPGLNIFQNWRNAEHRIEWGAILLIAAGFTLGAAAENTGLASYFVQNFLVPYSSLPEIVQPFILNITSALATIPIANQGGAASLSVPFAISYAESFDFNTLAMALSVGIGTSTQYILVTASPSFVLAYAHGYFSFTDFAKIGVFLTIIGSMLVALTLAVNFLI